MRFLPHGCRALCVLVWVQRVLGENIAFLWRRRGDSQRVIRHTQVNCVRVVPIGGEAAMENGASVGGKQEATQDREAGRQDENEGGKE